MNLRRSFAVTKRILKDLRNDKRTIALICIAPIFSMFVFGLAFSGDVKDVRMIVVDNDDGYAVPPGGFAFDLSDQIISNLDEEVLDLEHMDSADDAVREVENGNAYAVLVFPLDFSRDAYLKLENESYSGNTTIRLLLDRSNVNVAGAIAENVNRAIFETAGELGQEPHIALDSENAIYGQNAEFMDFFVPGIISFVVYLLTTLLTLIAFVIKSSLV
ncbi:MAG: ABC transporter permease, partial [Thermoplasmata archaeon]|nr:ABC transporter permease [Thermoplasmata archaeon]